MFEENYLFHVPEQKRIKVILDSDVRNEVDDYACADDTKV